MSGTVRARFVWGVALALAAGSAACSGGIDLLPVDTYTVAVKVLNLTGTTGISGVTVTFSNSLGDWASCTTNSAGSCSVALPSSAAVDWGVNASRNGASAGGTFAHHNSSFEIRTNAFN